MFRQRVRSGNFLTDFGFGAVAQRRHIIDSHVERSLACYRKEMRCNVKAQIGISTLAGAFSMKLPTDLPAPAEARLGQPLVGLPDLLASCRAVFHFRRKRQSLHVFEPGWPQLQTFSHTQAVLACKPALLMRIRT